MGVKHEDVERELVAEIEPIKEKGVTAAEVQTAVADSSPSGPSRMTARSPLGNAINDCIAVGDWTLYATLEDKIKAVTPADVQRVAQKYFTEDQSTVGWFIPTETASIAAAVAKEETSSRRMSFRPRR